MKLLLMRLGFSLIWGGAGLYFAKKTLRALTITMDWKKRGVVTEGVIVDFKAELPTGDMDNTRGKFYTPIVEYTAASGMTARITSKTGNRPNPYVVGQRVAIRYLPEDPLNGEVDKEAVSWFACVAFVVATVVCLTVASVPFLLAPPAPR